MSVFDRFLNRDALHEAVLSATVGLRDLREGAEATAHELAREEAELATVERRGRMAAEIDDGETAEVAERFAAKHREKVAVLRQKHAAQLAEVTLAEKELAEMKAALRQRGPDPAVGRAAAEASLDDDVSGFRERQQHLEAAVDAQLEALKRKLRRDDA
ncbi:MAG: hypothetical protein NW201_05475 [Gemmatimonadales bacterium]|nr:hypothetical protein [Gemmatimonadales bacterium]